jgi:hypothetical protein
VIQEDAQRAGGANDVHRGPFKTHDGN